jgi:hypothetical protein
LQRIAKDARRCFARIKKVKEEEAGCENSSTDNVNSWSAPDYQIYIPLGWAPW